MSTTDQSSELQARLDRAMRTLADARSEENNRGALGSCLVLVGSVLSSLLVLIGLALATCSYTSHEGALLAIFGAVGLAGCVAAHRRVPLAQEFGYAKIFDIAELLTGSETLQIEPEHRANLHQLLHTTSPTLAVAILKLLTVVGDRTSLRHAQGFGGISSDMHMFSTAKYKEVRDAAVETAERLARRLELAEKSGTLLRPAAPLGEQELLRPADSARTASGLLLRPGEHGPLEDED